jgi:Zn ribbon nucleic-acid-binding protein
MKTRRITKADVNRLPKSGRCPSCRVEVAIHWWFDGRLGFENWRCYACGHHTPTKVQRDRLAAERKRKGKRHDFYAR